MKPTKKRKPVTFAEWWVVEVEPLGNPHAKYTMRHWRIGQMCWNAAMREAARREKARNGK